MLDPWDPILNDLAKEVSRQDFDSPLITRLVQSMLEMATLTGKTETDTRQILGLAAPQIGASWRVIMIDIASTGMRDPQDLRIFINPRITYRSKQTLPGREGCWSTGNICANVERSSEVVLEALDLNGKPVSHRFAGFTARIAQHETDHLDGIRFPDRVDDDDRLHWVEHKDFDDYRLHWQNWPNKCPRVVWEKMKSGQH